MEEIKELTGVGALPAAEETGQGAEKRTGEDYLLSHLETWEYLRDLDIKVECVVDRLIPKGSVTIISAPGGRGKTWVALIMAQCVGDGIPFMGLATIKCPVVYIDCENPLAVLSERIKKLGSAGNVRFWRANSAGLRPPKLDSDDWSAYKHLTEGSVLIFDTLRSSHSGDENSSRDMGLIMERLKELRDLGFTIIMLCHTPKNNDTTAKGSSAITDLCDHTLCLTEEDKNSSNGLQLTDNIYRLGSVGKSRYERHAIYLTFNPEKGFERAPDPIADTVTQDDALGQMFRVLLESGEMNKTEFLKCCGDAGIGSRQELINLFEAGIGKYWTVDKGAHNTHRVKPVQFSSFPNPDSTQKLENCTEAAGNDCCPEMSDDGKAETSVPAPPQETSIEATGLSGADNPGVKVVEEPEPTAETMPAEKQSDIESKVPSVEPVSGKESADMDSDNEDDFTDVEKLLSEIRQEQAETADDEE